MFGYFHASFYRTDNLTWQTFLLQTRKKGGFNETNRTDVIDFPLGIAIAGLTA